MKKSLCIFLVTVLCVTLCMGAFSLSAFATVNPNYLVPSFSGTPSIDNSFVAFKNSSNETYRFAVNSARMAGTCVACSYPGYILFLCTSRPDGYWLYYSSNGSSFNNYNAYNTITYNSTTYYILQWNASSATEIYCEQASSYDSALAACVAALDYSPAPVDPVFDHTVSMYIQPGTMVRIKSPGNLTWNLETTFDYTCRKVNNVYLWQYNSCYSFVSSSAASVGFSTSSFVQYIEAYNQHLIPWLRLEPTNIFGNSYNAKYASVTALNGDYLYIYIPVIDYNFVDSWFFSGLFRSESQNHPVLLECDNASEIVVYTMGESVSSGFIIGTVQTYYTYTEDGLFENANGDVTDQVSTSSADADPETTVLDGLVSRIASLFTGVWSHISSLGEAIGSFPSLFSSLFSFLPSDITSIIVSLFGVLCALGVVKALL